jgi:hypothetical protein
MRRGFASLLISRGLMLYKVPVLYRSVIGFLVVGGWAQTLIVFVALPVRVDLLFSTNNIGGLYGVLILASTSAVLCISVMGAMFAYVRRENIGALVLFSILMWVGASIILLMPVLIVLKILFIIIPLLLGLYSVKVMRVAKGVGTGRLDGHGQRTSEG